MSDGIRVGCGCSRILDIFGKSFLKRTAFQSCFQFPSFSAFEQPQLVHLGIDPVGELLPLLGVYIVPA
jgi:hypothetical protein